MLVFRAFEEAFGPRLSRVDLVDIDRMLALLIADSEVRAWAALGKTYSEDAIAHRANPRWYRSCARGRSRGAGGTGRSWEAIDPFYESLLVMVLTLTQAVAPD